jgi:hypothetical protein
LNFGREAPKVKMDDEKARAYADLAMKMTELHASVALLARNVEKMARTDAEVTEMTKIFHGVYVSDEHLDHSA